MKRRHSSKYTLLLLASILSAPLAFAEPTGGTVVNGAATISSGTNSTDILQSTNHAAINWNSFSIAEGEAVNFTQPSTSSIMLNTDLSGTISQIHGEINANGHIFIVNTAGILFGATSQIDVGGLLATDLVIDPATISDSLIAAADENLTAGGVENQGSIHTALGGTTLIGQSLINSGTISSTGGDIYLVAAEQVNLLVGATGSIGVELTEPIKNLLGNQTALIDNREGGIIAAIDGADIHYNTQFIENLAVASTINREGTETTLAMIEEAGEIFIVETINESSSLDAAIDNATASAVQPVTVDTNTFAPPPFETPEAPPVDTSASSSSTSSGSVAESSATETGGSTTASNESTGSDSEEQNRLENDQEEDQQIAQTESESTNERDENKENDENQNSEDEPDISEEQLVKYQAASMIELIPCEAGCKGSLGETKKFLGRMLIKGDMKTQP